MKILLLNQTFYPDVASTAQHLADLAVGLARDGHEVSVVCSRRAYDQPEKRFPAREQWQGIEIHRVGSTGFGKRAKWRRAADFASFLLNCTFKAFTLPRHDAVIALTSPPLISFIGAVLTRIRGGDFYYWVMDLNPDEAVEAGWLRKGSPTERLLESLSRFSLRRAKRIIALDRFMEERITAKGIDRDRIEVLAPWSHDDAVRYDASGRDLFRREHGLEDKFVIMYSGNHSPCHPLDTLLESARVLSEDDGLRFCFVGGGSEFSKVKRFAKEHQLKSIICLPYQPLEKLAGSLSAADLHVVVMGEPFVGTIHPCKIYNILNVQAPVLYIGPGRSHVADVITEIGRPDLCGHAEHGDLDAVTRHIREFSRQAASRATEAYREVTAKYSVNRLLPLFIKTVK